MLDTTRENLSKQSKEIHDINASISALMGAVDVINDEWQSNPDLVEKIIPLTLDKLSELQFQLQKYRKV